MIPATIRNRNPGAQYPGPSSKKFGSTTFETLRSKDGVHKIATFPTHVHGAAAMFHLLHARYLGLTLEAAITKWCGGYYVSTYLKVLRDRSGIDGASVLTDAMMRDHEVAIPLAKAMAWQETGKEYPLTDEDWLEAHQMAFGSEASAPAWNPRNDVPTPKEETRRNETVKAVAKHPATIATTIGSAAVAAKDMLSSGVPEVPAVATKSLENADAWKKVGGGVWALGTEAVGVVGMAGKLWPYLLVAAGASAVLAFLKWGR